MSSLTLLLQFFFDQRARRHVDRFREASIKAVEKGRRLAIAGAFFTLAGAFFFSGLLLGLIDLGLQIDRQNGVSYSGLMISATILTVIGLACVLIGWICGRDVPAITMAAAPPPPLVRNDLRDALENLAVMFIREFQEQRKASRSASTGSVTPE